MKIDRRESGFSSLVFKLIFIIWPLLFVGFVWIINGSGIVPVFSDEISWYNQVKDVIEFGKPIGYYGYNGTHATVGTFGPWGAPIVYFMSVVPFIIDKIFSPEGYWSIVAGNIVWLAVANSLFLALTKPNKKTVIKLVVLETLLFVSNFYLTVSMAEILRYSMAIILAGLIYYIFNNEGKSRAFKVILYVATPLSILAFMSGYILFSAMLPMWFFAVYKRNKSFLSKHKVIFATISAVLWLGVTAVIYYIVTILASSPYFESTVGNILSAFGKSLSSGLICVFKTLLENIRNIDVWSMISSIDESNGFISFFVLLYYVVLVWLVYLLYKAVKAKRYSELQNNLCSAYIMLIFPLAFVMFYSTSSHWTYVRGLNIAFVFAMYFQTVTKDYGIRFKNFALISMYGLILFAATFYNLNMPGRFIKDESEITKYESIFAEHIKVNENADPWENTVACYEVNSYYLALPAGAAINYHADGVADENARYTIVNVVDESEYDEALVNRNLEINCEVIYKDDNLVLLKRNGD